MVIYLIISWDHQVTQPSDLQRSERMYLKTFIFVDTEVQDGAAGALWKWTEGPK